MVDEKKTRELPFEEGENHNDVPPTKLERGVAPKTIKTSAIRVAVSVHKRLLDYSNSNKKGVGETAEQAINEWLNAASLQDKEKRLETLVANVSKDFREMLLLVGWGLDSVQVDSKIAQEVRAKLQKKERTDEDIAEMIGLKHNECT